MCASDVLMNDPSNLGIFIPDVYLGIYKSWPSYNNNNKNNNSSCVNAEIMKGR